MASTSSNQVFLFNLRDGRFVQVIEMNQHIEQPFTESARRPSSTTAHAAAHHVDGVHSGVRHLSARRSAELPLLLRRERLPAVLAARCAQNPHDAVVERLKVALRESSHNICIFTLPDLKLNTVLSSPIKIDSLCVSSDNRALLAGAESGEVFCFGLNLRWKEKKDEMPARVDEGDIETTEDLE